MFDKKKFKAQVLLSGKTLQDVADLLGINIATLYRKMNGESDFYRHEMKVLSDFLQLKNPNEIFFADEIT